MFFFIVEKNIKLSFLVFKIYMCISGLFMTLLINLLQFEV